MTLDEEDRIRRAEEIQRYTENRCEALEEDNLNKQELINDYVFENAKLIKENAELKKDKEWLDNTNNEQTEVILQLQAQIEKMKNCQNCKHSFRNGGYEEKCEGCFKYESEEDFCINKKTYLHWELAE